MRALVAGALALAACASTPAPKATLADLDWIGGCWESADHSSFERWAPISGLVRRGEGYRTENGAAVFRETLRLEQTPDAVIYWGQPEGQTPTPFRLAEHGTNWARFENFAHDHPKTLRYQRKGETLRAWTGDGSTEELVLDVRLSGCD